MRDSGTILDLVKRCSLETMETSQPTDFCYGTVVSVNPLKINVEQKMELSINQLVLTRNTSEYQMSVTIPGEIGQVDITIHNALKQGEKVILLKKKGGQKYLVIDRLVNL